MLPIGQELQRRGHQVTFIGLLDAQVKVAATGINVAPIGEAKFPLGFMVKNLAQLGELSGIAALRFTIATLKEKRITRFQEIPTIIKRLGIEALLVDQVTPEGGTIAEYVGIPFVTICSAVVLNRSPNIPPFNTPWLYNQAKWATLRNWLGYRLLTQLTKPITTVTAMTRKEWHLPKQVHPNDAYSPLAQISQQPSEFEFPRQNLPPWFHFTGPYHYSIERESVSFPYERLTGQPLIYASMGTIQNQLIDVFQTIAAACNGLEAQLVLSLGGSAHRDDLPTLTGNPIVVDYAPQLELLRQAQLVITHGGMNTTLEALTNGVPMIAIPIANDQPGISSRIVWSGTGERIILKQLTVEKLRAAVEKILQNDSYKNNALRLKTTIEQSGGVKQAANIIEQAISTGQPVLS